MKIKYESDGSESVMKTPILASMFNAVGWLVVVATVALVFVAFSRGEKIATIPAALIIGGSGGILALTFFGIGQVLVSIARIEFYASTEKNEAILRSLHKIEGHLANMRERTKEAQPPV